MSSDTSPLPLIGTTCPRSMHSIGVQSSDSYFKVTWSNPSQDHPQAHQKSSRQEWGKNQYSQTSMGSPTNYYDRLATHQLYCIWHHQQQQYHRSDICKSLFDTASHPRLQEYLQQKHDWDDGMFNIHLELDHANTSIPKTLTSGTSPVPSGSPRSPLYLASTSYPMDPTQQITPWILLWGEWCYLMHMHCSPHPTTLQLLLWAWIQWYSCMFNKPLEDRPLDTIKIWLSVRQLQWPSKIPESRSYLNEPFSKDYGEEPPSYTSSWLYRMYLFHLLAAPNLWSILLMMHVFLFHSEGR